MDFVIIIIFICCLMGLIIFGIVLDELKAIRKQNNEIIDLLKFIEKDFL